MTKTPTKPEIQRRFLQIDDELIKDNELTMSVIVSETPDQAALTVRKLSLIHI